MRLEKMNEEDRKKFIDKFSIDELESISKLLVDLNRSIKIHQISDLILDIKRSCKDYKKVKDIDMKYILKKFDYGELLTLNDLFEIYDDEKYQRERFYVSSGIRNYQLLAKQTQDFECLGFDLAVYYWESLSPQVKKWYSTLCNSNDITPSDLYVYCKKINDIKYGRRSI